MSSTTFDEELSLNRDAYEREQANIRQAGIGQYVAIAHGKVVTITPDFDLAVQAVHNLSPAPEHYLVFPANEEPIYDIIDDFFDELVE